MVELPKHRNVTLLENMRWNVAGNIIGRTVGPLFQIIIARLLRPADFGLFAIVLAVSALLEIVRDLGFSPAIIVDTADEDCFSLQFTLQLSLAVILFVIVLILTPVAVTIFAQPDLALILPIIGSIVFLTAISDPVTTSLLKKQCYQTLAFRQILMPLVTGVTGLLLANADYGVYALVLGLLAGHVANTAFLGWLYREQFHLTWRPDSLSRLFCFGRHIIIQRMSGFLVNQADSFFISANLGTSRLGVYRLGNQLAFLLPSLVFPQIQQVLFTEFSAQVDQSTFSSLYYRYVRLSGALLLSYSMATWVLTPYIIEWLLGAQWSTIVPVIQLISVGVVTGYLAALNVDVGKPLGIVRKYTVFLILRALVTITAIIIASTYSLQAAVSTWVVTGLLANVANEIMFHRYQKIIQYRLEKLLIYLSAWCWAGYVIRSVQF